MAGSISSDARELETWHGKTILVLGDVMLDRFVYGEVDRISPEGPIPVLKYQTERFMLGGAANVARNVRSLGGRAMLVGVLGKDAEGNLIADHLLPEEEIEGYCVRKPGYPTTIKTRFVSGGQQMLRLDIESLLASEDSLTGEIVGQVHLLLPQVDALILSDYAKGVLSRDVISAVIALAGEAGVPVIVDPKNSDMAVYRGAKLVTPNALEARNATGFDTATDNGAEFAARSIRDSAGVDAVVLTRGAQGMTVFAPGEGIDGGAQHIPTSASEVFDVSGAGDTVIATLALGIAANFGVERSAMLANAAAGIAVAKRGTAAVYSDELARALIELSFEEKEDKVFSREALLQIVRRWQDEGKSVGLTNGCFDLIHPGHVAVLKKARAACDRLIVALNTDESVRRLKGPTRPIQNESARAIVMASIGSVDAVTLFNEETPLELIELLRPDVLIKGADYRLEEVVGGDVVQAYGGKVVLIPLEEGQSTTSMIARAN